MDRVGDFLRERTPRRFIAVTSFLALLVLFRQLLILLVFFVAFVGVLGMASRLLSARLHVRPRLALATVVLLALLVATLGAVFGAEHAVQWITQVRETLPQRIAEIRNLPAYNQARGWLHDTDKLVAHAQDYAAGAVGYLAALGHGLVYLTVGFILSVVFLLEEAELTKFRAEIPATSLRGTLLRWLAHLSEAVVVTLQLQLVVALCNAVLTLPVLFLLGLPHKPLLLFMIFASSLVPVVGNLLSGIVLSVMAFQQQGWLGVGLFLGLTAVLHKIESYYLNPRLTARHVHLPGFVLIISIIAWEHALGFIGLFASFPFLFIAGRIRAEWLAEDRETAPAEPL